MTKFLLPFAIKIIDAAVDKIPEDLEDKLKEFVIGLLKKGCQIRQQSRRPVSCFWKKHYLNK